MADQPREDQAELRGVLDDELARLPGRLRRAVILCDLEGLPQEEAARRLGCPLGTVKSRLSRARGRLKGRLLRRGVTPAAFLSATFFDAATARAAVPAALHASTLYRARVEARSRCCGVSPDRFTRRRSCEIDDLLTDENCGGFVPGNGPGGGGGHAGDRGEVVAGRHGQTFRRGRAAGRPRGSAECT